MESIYKDKFEKLKEKVNILIITAADCEKEAFNNELNPLENEKDILRYRYDGYEYFIGMFGKYNVVHVKTDEGNLGSNSSLITMYKTLLLWTNIKLAIMIGIACGIKNPRREIGDILVSEKIFYYEKCKINDSENEIIYNNIIGNPLIESSRSLLQIFKDKEEWNYTINIKENKEKLRQVQVISGMLFSGEKIIASSKAQEKILDLFKGTAIGFEMEGAGLAYACNNLKFNEWIVIKGISDFGEGEIIKDRNRKRAIESVISYCKYKFNQKGIFNNILQINNETQNIKIDDDEKNN